MYITPLSSCWWARSSRIRERTVANNLALHLPPVEVPVATTGGTAEGCGAPLPTGGHKLPATVHRVSSDIGCMVLLAFAVSHRPDKLGARAPERSYLPHNHLPLLHSWWSCSNYINPNCSWWWNNVTIYVWWDQNLSFNTVLLLLRRIEIKGKRLKIKAKGQEQEDHLNLTLARGLIYIIVEFLFFPLPKVKVVEPVALIFNCYCFSYLYIQYFLVYYY